MNVAGVVNKEREAEKGKSPLASLLKEKGEEKEISTSPTPYPESFPAHAASNGEGEGKVDIDRSCNGKGKVLRLRRRRISRATYFRRIEAMRQIVEACHIPPKIFFA